MLCLHDMLRASAQPAGRSLVPLSCLDPFGGKPPSYLAPAYMSRTPLHLHLPAGQLDCHSPGHLFTYLSQEHKATMIDILLGTAEATI